MQWWGVIFDMKFPKLMANPYLAQIMSCILILNLEKQNSYLLPFSITKNQPILQKSARNQPESTFSDKEQQTSTNTYSDSKREKISYNIVSKNQLLSSGKYWDKNFNRARRINFSLIPPLLLLWLPGENHQCGML